MKFFYLISTFLLATTAYSQSLAGLPKCATKCVANNIPQKCNLDPKCICETKSFISGVACCVSKACPKKSQQLAVLAYAKAICKPVGVTNLPKSATCAKTAKPKTSAVEARTVEVLAASATSSASVAALSPSAVASAASNASSGSATGVAVTSGTAAASATGNAAAGLVSVGVWREGVAVAVGAVAVAAGMV